MFIFLTKKNIKNSYVTGKVTSGFRVFADYTVSTSIIGGLIGKSNNQIIIKNSYVVTNINAESTSDLYIGGIVRAYSGITLEEIWQEISSSWDNEVWEIFTYKDPLLK